MIFDILHIFLMGRVYEPDNSTLRVVTRSNWMVRDGPTSRDVQMIVTPAVQVSSIIHTCIQLYL